MKILHVIETLGAGGAERSLVMLLGELRRRGEDVAVGVLKEPLTLRPELETAGVPVFVLPAHNKWNLIAGARNVSRLASERHCDVIHTHLYFATLYTALARVFRLTRARTCVTFHNLAYEEGVNRPGFGLWLRRILATVFYPRGFDRMLAVSAAVAGHYREALRLDDVAILNNPVDMSRIAKVSEPSRPPHALDHVKLVVPGRLVPEKGHSDFLEALAVLRHRGHMFQATLAGDGPLRSQIEARIKALDLSDRVCLTGALEYDAMLEVISSADIVVTPSRFEGFALTALEAMALGRPVVATRAGGLAEIANDGKTGVLVPAGDTKALSEAILSLAKNDSMRRRLGEAGRARAEAQFALPRIVDQLLDLYRSMMGDGSGP